MNLPSQPDSKAKRGWLLREFGQGLSPRTVTVCLYSLGVGAVAAFVALGLLRLINALTWVFFYGRWSWAVVSPVGNHLGAWIILIPAIGGGIVGLMIHFWEPSLKGHGIPEAMQAVLLDEGMVRGRVAFLKPLATALAIGTGGPFGAEGPIIQTGASLGSLLAQKIKLHPYDRRVLLAAGAAAGMSATFLAPLAGIMVAIELILFEFKARSFIPVALSSSIAAAISISFRGSGPMFAMPLYELQSLHELWLFALLGVIAALIGLAMTRVLFALEDLFDRLPLKPVAVWSPLLGGLILGALGLAYPQILGTGYSTIRAMLNGQMTYATGLGVSFTKFWALVISLGSGTTGGVFAPSLIVGGGFGAAFAEGMHKLLPALPMSPPGLYALTAMAAVFGGIARAPFSAIVFLFELSQNPHAVLPLIVCCMVADLSLRLLSADSIMTGKLARRGLVISQDYSAPFFLHTPIRDVMLPISSMDTQESEAFANATAVVAKSSDSAGLVIRALMRNKQEFAVVVSDDPPPRPIGVVRANDIWALQRYTLDPDTAL